jgi:hypothetical protein
MQYDMQNCLQKRIHWLYLLLIININKDSND